jgi:hypothetical protein
MEHSRRIAGLPLTSTIMAPKGWFNLEGATNSALPDTSFFEGDSAFKFLGLTRQQRLYGFVGWWVFHNRATNTNPSNNF